MGASHITGHLARLEEEERGMGRWTVEPHSCESETDAGGVDEGRISMAWVFWRSTQQQVPKTWEKWWGEEAPGHLY